MGVILVLVGYSSYGQCALTLGADSLDACVGDTVFLSASGADSFQWSHDASLSCDTCAMPYIIMTDTSQYVLVKGTTSVSQYATNGTFSSGNTGFVTNYTHNATSIWNEGTYAVGPNPNSVHPNFGTWGDHTTGTGNYMLVNGATSGNKILWRQQLTFPPGIQVTMSWWALTFVTPAGSLQLKLFGANVGNSATTPTSTGVWQQTSRTFTVPASGAVTLNLVTLSSALAGNDFGLDDIRFSYSCEATDTVWIAPKNNAQVLLDAEPVFGCDSVCIELANVLDSSGALAYQWMLSDGTVDSSATFSHCLQDSGAYTGMVRTTSAEGCVDSAYFPPIRVGYTRQLDSLIIANDGSGTVGGIRILNGSNTIGLGAHYEAYAGSASGLDSLVVRAGGQEWIDSTVTRMQLASGWSPVGLAREPMTICAYLYTSDGCVDSLCQDVAFYPEVDVPNVFTPNGDGLNDELTLQTRSAEQIHVIIYNRWGTKVFETYDLGTMWDGNWQGRPAADGVYFLTVEVSNPYSQTPLAKQATIHLVR